MNQRSSLSRLNRFHASVLVFGLILATLLPLTIADVERTTTSAFIPGRWDRFMPHSHLLYDAVRAADIIFVGTTTSLDLSRHDSIHGGGTYSGVISPKTFLKGRLAQRKLELTWEPSATGIEPGSNHIFLVRTRASRFEVVKEIFVHQPPHMMSRTYWAYDGGLEATLQTIRLMVNPSDPSHEYAATLVSDLKQDGIHRQATAVRLASETLRPECLSPLLFAITNRVEDYVQAIFAACRLDGVEGSNAALALLGAPGAQQYQIFDAISAARNPASTLVLEKFGTDYPEYRVSCAFAIREIAPDKLPLIIGRWRSDDKHGKIYHQIYRNKWSTRSMSADDLLAAALSGKPVFDDRN